MFQEAGGAKVKFSMGVQVISISPWLRIPGDRVASEDGRDRGVVKVPCPTLAIHRGSIIIGKGLHDHRVHEPSKMMLEVTRQQKQVMRRRNYIKHGIKIHFVV